jgi:hypothetical protein
MTHISFLCDLSSQYCDFCYKANWNIAVFHFTIRERIVSLQSNHCCMKDQFISHVFTAQFSFSINFFYRKKESRTRPDTHTQNLIYMQSTQIPKTDYIKFIYSLLPFFFSKNRLHQIWFSEKESKPRYIKDRLHSGAKVLSSGKWIN